MLEKAVLELVWDAEMGREWCSLKHLFSFFKENPFSCPLASVPDFSKATAAKDQGFRTLEDFPLLYSCCQAQQLFTVAVMRMQVLKEPKRSINTF